MKNYIAIVLTLILIALLGIGFLLYSNFGFGKSTKGFEVHEEASVVEKQDINEDTSEDIMNVIEEPTGSISGEICYPSEGIPPLTVYFKDIVTLNVVDLETELNQSEYEVDDIPTGSYIAYAYVDGIDGDGGGYTQAVECGLTTDCEDHTLIEFEVLEDELTSGVDICDWYGAEIPEEM
jgi:hypothetical protein